MKKFIILAVLLIGISTTAEAQLKTNSTPITKNLSEEDRNKLANYKSLLDALDSKEAWIRSNPEQLKLAEKNGWFINANTTRKEVLADIELIKTK